MMSCKPFTQTRCIIRSNRQLIFLRNGSRVAVPFTADRYNIHRKSFAKVTDDDARFFRSVLGDGKVISGADELDAYNVDWLHTCRGQAKVALRPTTTEQVSKILKYCNDRKLAVCPQGGNTGFVGGSVPVFDEIVLSLSLMSKIISLDDTGLMVSDAGVILQDLDNHAAEFGRIVPLDLGAKGSCQIGGNVSTNAGGLRLLRYGSLHANVLGLEVVLANGTILPFGSNMRKDNTGFHLHHNFIGSEGTLGVVTKVAILCPPRPTAVSLCLLGVNSFQDVIRCFKEASGKLTDIMSAFEFLDRDVYFLSCRNQKIPPPLKEYPFYVMIEISGWTAEADTERLGDLLESMMAKGLASDGVVTDEPARLRTLWTIRETVAEAQTNLGYCYKYDLSIPKADMYKLVEDLRKRLGSSVESVTGYGHVGDNNLHLTVLAAEYNAEVANRIEPFVYEWTRDHGGSISAEHGIGFKKRNQLVYNKSATNIAVMRQMKQLFDPNGILNPYKVLPDVE